MNKKTSIIIGVAAACAAVAFGAYAAMNEDMTGKPYSEIEAYKAEHPKVNVTYTVTVDGTEPPVELSNEDLTLTLSHREQLDSCMAQAEYLQNLETLDLGDISLRPFELQAVQEKFSDAELLFNKINFLGKTYDRNTKSVDLSDVTGQDIDEAAVLLSLLPNLKEVNLNQDGVSAIVLDDAAKLQAAVPEVFFTYTTTLFGQEISTDMERVEYFQVHIGDEGLPQFRTLLPLMQNLTYLRLDWCDTTDEAMAQLRDDFPEIKVVWRIFFNQFNCLTDTYRLWATYSVKEWETGPLKYCTEVRYLDLGHNRIKTIDFCNYMPHLEVVILAETMVEDLTPLRNCPEITFLELFGNGRLADISGVEALTKLEHLNMTRLRHVTDISPIMHLENLQRMYCSPYCPEEQMQEFIDLHPDCETQFYYGDSTATGWRYRGGVRVPRYALLGKQIGYDISDFSIYPKGYLDHEINSLDDPIK